MSNSSNQHYESIVKVITGDDVKAKLLAVPAFNDLDFELLILALKNENALVRSLAANALATLGNIQALDPLLVALDDPDAGVCCSAITALGEFGDKRAVEPIISKLSISSTKKHWLKEEASGVRIFAARILGQIGDAKALPALEWALHHDKGKSQRGSTVKEAAAEAIQNIQARQNS